MSDALARLRNRQRPTVPDRDASLNSKSLDILTSGNQDSQNSDSSASLSTKAGQGADTELLAISKPEASTPKTSSDKRHSDIETSTLPEVESFDTKQSTLRLEAVLSDRLQSLCRSEGICREVLLEALFESFEVDADSQQEILLAAQAKNEHRQHIANLKRAQSMMKRFGGGN